MARSANRKRIACSACGLPFYADRGACPYCDAGIDGRDDAGDAEFVFDNEESTSPESTAGDEDAGVVGRLKRALGL